MAYFIGVVMGIAACIWIKNGAGNFYFQYGIYGVSILIGEKATIRIAEK